MTDQNTTVIKTDPVNHHLADLTIISLKRFIFLSIISLGLYELWWIFKAWRFFAIKDHLNIMPAARAIFSIFFLYSLFKKNPGICQSARRCSEVFCRLDVYRLYPFRLSIRQLTRSLLVNFISQFHVPYSRFCSP